MEIDDLLAMENELVFIFPYDIEEPIKIEKNVPIKLPYYLVEFLLENEHCSLREEFFNDLLIGRLRNIPTYHSISSFNNFYGFASKFGQRELLSNFLTERMKVFSDYILEDETPDEVSRKLEAYEDNLINYARHKFCEYKLHKK